MNSPEINFGIDSTRSPATMCKVLNLINPNVQIICVIFSSAVHLLQPFPTVATER